MAESIQKIMRIKPIILCLLICMYLSAGQLFASMPIKPAVSASHPIEALVGEQLTYDVSFLWFDRLAIGTIQLTRGEQPGTYVAMLEARTRGFSAFVTNHRVERYQTVMEVGPDGLLRPLEYSAHTLKGEGQQQREMETSYSFDYIHHQVLYQKIKNHIVKSDEMLPLDSKEQVFDILSAFYNLRIGSFGPIDKHQIHLPTFQRKGIEEIVVEPIAKGSEKDSFFSDDNVLCKVLLNPEVFGTDGRDLLVSFNEHNQPQKAVVKNVIGLGDVRGVLRQVVNPVAKIE